MTVTIRGPEMPDSERGYVDYIPLMAILPPDSDTALTAEALADEYGATVEQTKRDLERLRDEFSEALNADREGERVWWRGEGSTTEFDMEEYLTELEQEAPEVADRHRRQWKVVGEYCPLCGAEIEAFEEKVNGEFVTVQPCNHFFGRTDIARPSDYS